MTKRATCTEHASCTTSDSNLPECSCWCAECHEWRDTMRPKWESEMVRSFVAIEEAISR
jgi:hypothetical protein